MKLKAVGSENLPPELLLALDSVAVVQAFLAMIAEHLSVDPADIGPAAHYVQKTDLTIKYPNDEMGIEVTLSKVSVTDERAPNDFVRILTAIEDYYKMLIEQFVPAGKRVQLFSVLALDVPLSLKGQKPTSLPERGPIWVEGKKAA